MSWREDVHINKLRVGEKGLVATGGVAIMDVIGAVVPKLCSSVVMMNDAATGNETTVTMDAMDHPGLFSGVKQAGAKKHTITLTNGTWDGTNTVATFDAINSSIQVVFDLVAGRGTIIANTNVALS